MSTPRFSIGIDLGTTHSALAYTDMSTSDGERTSHGAFEIPQLTAPGAVEPQLLLPSFLYLPHTDEFAPGELSLPWGGELHGVVGELARGRGATTPIRILSRPKNVPWHPGGE